MADDEQKKWDELAKWIRSVDRDLEAIHDTINEMSERPKREISSPRR